MFFLYLFRGGRDKPLFDIQIYHIVAEQGYERARDETAQDVAGIVYAEVDAAIAVAERVDDEQSEHDARAVLERTEAGRLAPKQDEPQGEAPDVGGVAGHEAVVATTVAVHAMYQVRDARIGLCGPRTAHKGLDDACRDLVAQHGHEYGGEDEQHEVFPARAERAALVAEQPQQEHVEGYPGGAGGDVPPQLVLQGSAVVVQKQHQLLVKCVERFYHECVASFLNSNPSH